MLVLLTHLLTYSLIVSTDLTDVTRVAKYDGYIRLKILASWGKSLGGDKFLQNEAFFEEICTIYVRFLCLNYATLTESSTSVLQKYPYCQFCSILVPIWSQFRRFPLGNIWLEGFAPCKKIDILQLWIQRQKHKKFQEEHAYVICWISCVKITFGLSPKGRSPQICTVYLCVTLKNQIINPSSNANSLITRLVCVPTTTKTILGHLPDLL